jgi:hypothetical protein
MVFGAFVLSSLGPLMKWLPEPSRLVYSPAHVPQGLRVLLSMMAVLVLVSGIQDGIAAFKLRNTPRRTINLSSDLGPDAAVHKKPLTTTAPFWMKSVLLVAGVYNLAWGAFVVFFPELPFRWAGMAPINYYEVWQCVGMIVGVYGIGYIIASRSPYVHWPIVLVGLLGKLFGPLGMSWAILRHRLPITAALTCLTNDVVWWVPFGLILLGAYRWGNRHKHGLPTVDQGSPSQRDGPSMV